MTARLGRMGAVAITLVVAYGVAPSHGAAQASDPTVAIDRTGTAAGEEMLITGTGWPDAATLVVELCGHGGLRGTVDCDVPHQRTAGVGSQGTFSVQLTVGLPPQPCPCVVKVTDQRSHVAATAPIAVAGIPTVPITDDDRRATRSIEISTIRITGGGHWAELFGAGGRRVLELTLVNTGPLAVEAPHVTVVWGSGTQPTGFVPPPETTRMEPGETQTVAVALDRPALTIGRQTAVVEVQGLAAPVRARASTSAYPWGLLAVGLVLLQLVLLWVRNRIRRRLHRSPGVASGGPQPELVAVAAPPLALLAGPTNDGGTEAEPTVLDLDEPEHHRPIALGPAIDPRLERMALHLQARLVVNRAVALSDAIVQEATERAQELDARSAERLRGSLERHTEAVGVLEAAKAHADEIIATATAAAAGALRDAGSHEAGAHQALTELRSRHERLAESAALAIDGVMRDLDAQMARLDGLGDERRGGAGLRSVPRASRLGNLDDRLARAVSLAFTDAATDVTTTA